MKKNRLQLNTQLEKPKHGGDLLSLKRSDRENTIRGFQSHLLAETWIDLSSAVNRQPWPTPLVPNFLWHELPDQMALQDAAKKYYGIGDSVAVAGSQQAIELLPILLANEGNITHAEKTIYVPTIGYQEHGFSWKKWGYDLVEYDTKKTDFFTQLLTKDWHALIIIQPNNPSTHCFTKRQIQQLIEVANKRQAFVIVDEAFIDSRPEDSMLSLFIEEDSKQQNSTQQDGSKQGNKIAKNWPQALIILRSIGKFFGLPGARIGFVFASKKLRLQLASSVGPWPISTPATWLVAQALQDSVWQKNARLDLASRREKFANDVLPLLNQLVGILQCDYSIKTAYCWQHTDFFFTLTSTMSELLFTHLKAEKIYTRLGDGWLRFALPAYDEFPIIINRVNHLIQSHCTKSIKEQKA